MTPESVLYSTGGPTSSGQTAFFGFKYEQLQSMLHVRNKLAKLGEIDVGVVS